jgi:sigma-B regulation protein RsbU (phosphoserine phosphatase)
MVLVLAALAILAIRWSSGMQTNVPLHFLNTLVLGNVMFFLMSASAPLYANRGPPLDWLWYLPLIAGASILFAGLWFLLSERLIYGTVPLQEFTGEVKTSSIYSFLVGVLGYGYLSTRGRLRARAQKLESDVDSGQEQLRVQNGELQRAREMQDGFLPKNLPQMPGFEIAAAWKPASVVSGDYYDVLELDRAKLAVCVGDVVGKGMSAALLMANLQAGFHAYARLDLRPSEVCNRLNQLICSNVASGKFITFICALLEGTHGRLTVAHAGHCRPIWVSSSGELKWIDDSGAALGLFPNWKYRDFEYQLAEGDMLVLYTDGVVEAEDASGEEFREDRLQRTAQRYAHAHAAEIQAEIMREVGSFCGGRFQDDATVIVIKAR